MLLDLIYFFRTKKKWEVKNKNANNKEMKWAMDMTESYITGSKSLLAQPKTSTDREGD